MVDFGVLEITPTVWYGIAIIARGQVLPLLPTGPKGPRAIMKQCLPMGNNVAMPYHTTGVISNAPKSTIE